MNIQKYIKTLERKNVKGLIISKIYEVAKKDYDVLCIGLIDNEYKEYYFTSMGIDNLLMDIKNIHINYSDGKAFMRMLDGVLAVGRSVLLFFLWKF